MSDALDTTELIALNFTILKLKTKALELKVHLIRKLSSKLCLLVDLKSIKHGGGTELI